jgi:hypothetical protein
VRLRTRNDEGGRITVLSASVCGSTIAAGGLPTAFFKTCIDSHARRAGAATAPPLSAPPRPICTTTPAHAWDGNGATAPETSGAKLEICAPAHPSPDASSAASCALTGAGSPYTPSNDRSWSSGVRRSEDAWALVLLGLRNASEEKLHGARVRQRQDDRFADGLVRLCFLHRISRSDVRARRAAHDEGRHERGTADLDELGRDAVEPTRGSGSAADQDRELNAVYSVGLDDEQACPKRVSAPRLECNETCALEDLIVEVDGACEAVLTQKKNEERALLCGVSMSEWEAQGMRGSGRTFASRATPWRMSIPKFLHDQRAVLWKKQAVPGAS